MIRIYCCVVLAFSSLEISTLYVLKRNDNGSLLGEMVRSSSSRRKETYPNTHQLSDTEISWSDFNSSIATENGEGGSDGGNNYAELSANSKIGAATIEGLGRRESDNLRSDETFQTMFSEDDDIFFTTDQPHLSSEDQGEKPDLRPSTKHDPVEDHHIHLGSSQSFGIVNSTEETTTSDSGMNGKTSQFRSGSGNGVILKGARTSVDNESAGGFEASGDDIYSGDNSGDNEISGDDEDYHDTEVSTIHSSTTTYSHRTTQSHHSFADQGKRYMPGLSRKTDSADENNDIHIGSSQSSSVILKDNELASEITTTNQVTGTTIGNYAKSNLNETKGSTQNYSVYDTIIARITSGMPGIEKLLTFNDLPKRILNDTEETTGDHLGTNEYINTTEFHSVSVNVILKDAKSSRDNQSSSSSKITEDDLYSRDCESSGDNAKYDDAECSGYGRGSSDQESSGDSANYDDTEYSGHGESSGDHDSSGDNTNYDVTEYSRAGESSGYHDSFVYDAYYDDTEYSGDGESSGDHDSSGDNTNYDVTEYSRAGESSGYHDSFVYDAYYDDTEYSGDGESSGDHDSSGDKTNYDVTEYSRAGESSGYHDSFVYDAYYDDTEYSGDGGTFGGPKRTEHTTFKLHSYAESSVNNIPSGNNASFRGIKGPGNPEKPFNISASLSQEEDADHSDSTNVMGSFRNDSIAVKGSGTEQQYGVNLNALNASSEENDIFLVPVVNNNEARNFGHSTQPHLTTSSVNPTSLDTKQSRSNGTDRFDGNFGVTAPESHHRGSSSSPVTSEDRNDSENIDNSVLEHIGSSGAFVTPRESVESTQNSGHMQFPMTHRDMDKTESSDNDSTLGGYDDFESSTDIDLAAGFVTSSSTEGSGNLECFDDTECSGTVDRFEDLEGSGSGGFQGETYVKGYYDINIVHTPKYEVFSDSEILGGNYIVEDDPDIYFDST